MAVGCVQPNLPSTRGCTTPRRPSSSPFPTTTANCCPGKKKADSVGCSRQSRPNCRFDFLSVRSSAPCTTENTPFLLPSCTSSVMTAASLRRLRAPVSVVLSAMMQSPVSKSLQGSGFDLFSRMVLSNPGRRLVLPVWNSLVLAFSMRMSCDSSSLRMLVVTSAREQRAKLSTSLNSACASSCLSRSVNLLSRVRPPTVVEGGSSGTILVQPQQMATSSSTSHSCSTSPRQKGASTLYTPSAATLAVRPVRFRYPITCSVSSLAPTRFSAFLWRTVNSRGETLGVRKRSSPLMISTGSTWKGTWQYSEKDQMMALRQTKALGRLRAVTSMRTLRVLMEILECSPLMMGGTEQTTSLLSRTSGQTGLSRIRCRYSFSLWFSSSSIMPSPSTFASWFSGTNENSFGSFATQRNGPAIVSRSCVPIEAYLRARQKVSCSFSWAAMKALQVLSSKATLRRMAAAMKGRICLTLGSMVMEVVGAVSVTSGSSVLPRQSLKARTRLASESRSGRLFMQSNLRYSLSRLPFLSRSSSSSISMPNSKPRLSSHSNSTFSPSNSKKRSRSIFRLGINQLKIQYKHLRTRQPLQKKEIPSRFTTKRTKERFLKASKYCRSWPTSQGLLGIHRILEASFFLPYLECVLPNNKK